MVRMGWNLCPTHTQPVENQSAAQAQEPVRIWLGDDDLADLIHSSGRIHDTSVS
jgi:hypothetical protein